MSDIYNYVCIPSFDIKMFYVILPSLG